MPDAACPPNNPAPDEELLMPPNGLGLFASLLAVPEPKSPELGVPLAGVDPKEKGLLAGGFDMMLKQRRELGAESISQDAPCMRIARYRTIER